MIYRPVIDRVAVTVPLDPPSAALFAAAFIAVAILTARRPVYGLVALVLAAPLAFAHSLLGTEITLPKVLVLGVLLGCSTYRGAIGRLRDRPVPLLLAALGLLLLATALTAVPAVHRALVAREVLKVAQYAAFFIAAALCYRLDPEDRPIRAAVAIAAIAVSLSALAQELIGAPSGLFIGSAIVPRIAGLLEGPNQLSGYYEVAIATLGAMALVRRDSLLDAALALSVCADVLTFSRAGWFGLAVVAVILLFIGGARARHALQPALLGLAAGIVGSVGWAIYAHTPGVLRASLEPSLYAGGVGNRDELWHAAWRMFAAHPLFGVGAGNFELALPAYGLFGVRTHANSWYLQALAEGGVVLFAATIALIATIVVAFVDAGPMRRLRAGSPWIVAALAASAALALHQTVDYLVFYPKVADAWWLLLGTAAASSLSP
ncbi:MAG TPA: O-antigen ligase family protein [Candidatus Nitrosotalea sp.]|nr:O-antigen ligase family protein [Candidatus Nitrosotalea sp.]